LGVRSRSRHRTCRRDRRRHYRVAFSLRDGCAEPAAGREAWWRALGAPDLIDITRYTVLCPSWPGNRSTWREFEDAPSPPALSVSGLADLLAAWLEGCRCTVPVTFVGASLGGMVGAAFAVQHRERCGKLIVISGGTMTIGDIKAVSRLA